VFQLLRRFVELFREFHHCFYRIWFRGRCCEFQALLSLMSIFYIPLLLA
jgi:hypothetical protein